MQHLVIGVFGNSGFLKSIAKAGTINDIAMYNHADSEHVYTYVTPNSPENKLNPLLQVIGMIDIPVVASENITKELGEQIMALDAFGFENGFILSKSDELKQILKGTSLEKFQFIEDEKELVMKLKDVQSKPLTSETWLPVDNYFDVKGIGAVVLSTVKGGIVKKHDELFVQPTGKKVAVKNIQSQDKDFDEAGLGVRVGLNLKGIETSEIKRGYVLCKDANVAQTIKLKFVKSKFCKENIETGAQIFLSCGLQVIAGKIENLDITISLSQAIAYLPGQKCIIASTKQTLPRIIGSGILQ